MATNVIEHEPEDLECCTSCGNVDTVIGAVVTGEALVTVVVAGNPTRICLISEEDIEQGDGLRDTLDNVAAEQRTVAGIALDVDGWRGLMRLLQKAFDVYGRAASRST